MLRFFYFLNFIITTEITNGRRKYQAGTVSRTHCEKKKKSTHTHIHEKPPPVLAYQLNNFNFNFEILCLLFPELPW